MAVNDIYIGETVGSLQLMSALGRKLLINNIILSREDRTASGRLVQDIIATKKEFTLRYSAIDGSDLAVYLDLFDLNSELIIRVYNSVSTYNDYTVLMSPLSYQRVLATGDGLWEGVSVVFREV